MKRWRPAHEEVLMRIRIAVAMLLTAASDAPLPAAEGRVPLWTTASIHAQRLGECP
jgi:hypothetical protein